MTFLKWKHASDSLFGEIEHVPYIDLKPLREKFQIFRFRPYSV
jgi:hypothetical protein